MPFIARRSVSESNINRQISALHSTLGRKKTEAAAERVRDINPACDVRVYNTFYLPETRPLFDFSQYSYVVDAVDTVTAKLALIECANTAGVPIISCMGTGGKTDPTRLEVADIYETSIDPLARVMRRELKKRGVDSLKVVYSKEKPLRPYAGHEAETAAMEEAHQRRSTPGSLAFVPSVAGLIIAGEVIKDLVGFEGEHR